MNITSCIKNWKQKNHITISTNTENILDKIQPYLIKYNLHDLKLLEKSGQKAAPIPPLLHMKNYYVHIIVNG